MQEIGNFRINDHPLRGFLECQTIEKFLCRLITACFCAWYHNTSLNTSLIREFRSMWERNISGEQKRTLMSQTYIMVAKCCCCFYFSHKTHFIHTYFLHYDSLWYATCRKGPVDLVLEKALPV